MAKTSSWYVLHREKAQGPFSTAQLKQLVEAGKINQKTMIRPESSEMWSAAGMLKELFEAAAVPWSTEAVIELASPADNALRIPCPLCGEMIVATAIKCRHCHTFLDGRDEQEEALEIVEEEELPPLPTRPSAVESKTDIANPVVEVVKQPRGGPRVSTSVAADTRFNPTVALLLSLWIPGAGHWYKGKVNESVKWFFLVPLGYMLLFVPGLVLHIFCIKSAMTP